MVREGVAGVPERHAEAVDVNLAKEAAAPTLRWRISYSENRHSSSLGVEDMLLRDCAKA
jgi:hypothetical protein